jgi:endonuclease G, mitochondrial
MLQLNSDFRDNLLDTLLEIPALRNQENRDLLLRNLPPGPVSAISRSSAFIADLNNITSAVEAWGQLNSGEWALVVLTKNALRFAKGTQQGRDLETLLGELETLTLRDIPLLTPLEVPIEEVLIWQQDERLPVNFLERGLTASKAVAKVIVPRVLNGVPSLGTSNGSGWLISPDLLVTNHHVIEARDKRYEPAAKEADFQAQALMAIVWFNYTDRNVDYTEYQCVELVHFSVEFDYALLRLSPTSSSSSNKLLSTWGYLSVIQSKPILLKGSRLNIIQHPQGGPQRIAIRSNFYVDYISTHNSPERIRYLTDTEPGSSGSPVFNDEWQVLALHHAAVKVPDAKYKDEVVKYNNQGVLINAILDNLPDAVRKEVQEAQAHLSQ